MLFLVKRLTFSPSVLILRIASVSLARSSGFSRRDEKDLLEMMKNSDAAKKPFLYLERCIRNFISRKVFANILETLFQQIAIEPSFSVQRDYFYHEKGDFFPPRLSFFDDSFENNGDKM